MSKKGTASRRQRRLELRRANFLKIKSMYGPFTQQGQAWYSKMRQDGNAMQEQFLSRVMDAREEKLETTLNSLKETWTSMGYNAAEVEMLSEAWMLTTVKDSDRVAARADKKQSRKLMAEAKASYTERNS